MSKATLALKNFTFVSATVSSLLRVTVRAEELKVFGAVIAANSIFMV